MKGRTKTVYEFTDATGERFEMSIEDGALQLYGHGYEEDEKPSRGQVMLLCKQGVREALPLLQHFAETGELPEPKP